MPVDADKEVYYNLLSGKKNESKNSNIYDNYEICKNIILKSKYDVSSIYRALGHINTVYISLSEDENPQIVFESLNSTGLSLTAADLIRNFVLMGLNYELQKRLYKIYWENIEKNLTNSEISDFIKDYLTMKDGLTPKKDRVYESFKNYYFANEYEAEEILKELEIYSTYYKMILCYNSGIKKIDEQLEYIHTIGITVTYPFILKLLYDFFEKKIISEEDTTSVLKIIVSYLYRRYVCLLPNTLSKTFAPMSKLVDYKMENSSLGYLDSVIDYLMSRKSSSIFPRNEEFKDKFMNSDIYDKKGSSRSVIKEILYSIEKSIHKEIARSDDLSIEHIMPQNLSHEWQIELGKDSYETHKLLKHTFGNLTLTNSSYNQEASNKSFYEKKLIYKNSNISITRKISESENWGKEEMRNRAEELYNIASEVFELPEDNYSSPSELSRNEEYSIKSTDNVTGTKPRLLIIDGDEIHVSSWKDMLEKSCKYLYDYNEELFISLYDKPIFSRFLRKDGDNLRSPEKIDNNLFIETNFSAKDHHSHIALLFEEFELDDSVFFTIR